MRAPAPNPSISSRCRRALRPQSGLDEGGQKILCPVLLGLEAESLQQLGGALGMRRVVSRRRVGAHAHPLLQEADLLCEMGVDPAKMRARTAAGVAPKIESAADAPAPDPAPRTG